MQGWGSSQPRASAESAELESFYEMHVDADRKSFRFENLAKDCVTILIMHSYLPQVRSD